MMSGIISEYFCSIMEIAMYKWLRSQTDCGTPLSAILEYVYSKLSLRKIEISGGLITFSDANLPEYYSQ